MRNKRDRQDLSELPGWMRQRKCPRKAGYLSGTRIIPKRLPAGESLPAAGPDIPGL